MSAPTELLVFAKTHPTHKSIIDLANAGYCYCTPCKQIKPIDAFRPNPARANGAQSTCKDCEGIYNRQRNKTAHRIAFQKQRRERNREWRKQWRQNPEIRLKLKQSRKKYKTKTNQHAGVIRGIYILRMNDVFKIGQSTNIHRRVAELRGSLPFPAELIHSFVVEGDLSLAEMKIHHRYEKHRLNGEWFALTPDDIEEIKKAYSNSAKE